jgi:hypothetical protein
VSHSNLYYSPAAYGVEVVLDVDKSSGAYEFDMFAIWRSQIADLYYWASDSGCSCPVPFDSIDLSNACQGNLTEAKNDAYAWLGSTPDYNEHYWETARETIERALGRP